MPNANSERRDSANPTTIAAFDSTRSGRYVEDGYAVYPNALLFKSGNYEDKAFSLSPEEMWAAVDSFEPMSGNILHSKFLKGRACHVRSIHLDDKDSELLRGKVAVPLGLDELLEDGERQLSCEWNRVTKSLDGIALVPNPRVAGASLISTFSEMSEVNPDLDDRVLAVFTDRKKHHHTTNTYQTIHDVIRLGYPGACTGDPMKPPGDPTVGMSAADAAYFADHPQQLKNLRSIHETTVQNGAMCGSGKAKMSATNPRSNSMPTATDSAAFTNSPEYLAFQAKLDAAEAKATELAAKLAETSAESAATKAEFAATKVELEAARVKQVGIDAKAFALAEITAGRSISHEYQDLVADFTDAANADHASKELVTFSDATGAKVQGSRVDKLRAREAKRQGHGLFTPALGDGKLLNDGERILFNGKPNDEDSEAVIQAKADEVLAKTNDGRAVLARRKAGK